MGRHKSVLGVAVVLLLAVGCCMGQDPDGCAEHAGSCADCIQYSPDCIWCSTPPPPPDVTQDPPLRCLNRTRNMRCNDSSLEQDPVSSVTITKNEVGDLVQVRPQALNITARRGDTQYFNLTVLPTADFPLDLYILMDFSASLDDRLADLRTIASDITNTLANITSNFQVGFGTFVDKRTLPYTLQSFRRVSVADGSDLGCLSGRDNCTNTYSFLHQLNLTNNVASFQEVLNEALLSANVDNPEGGLDALVQAAVCGDIIGWRDTSLHMLLYFSDAEYHIAGDGRLAGVVRPNDGKCHIERSLRDDNFFEYILDTVFDYPSLYHLNSLLIENEIIPVFANTNPSFIDSYQTLEDVLDSAQSIFINQTAQLISIIQEAYDNLTQNVNPQPSGTSNIDVSFDVEPGCDDPTESGGCAATLGEEVNFRISVTINSCDGIENLEPNQVTIRVPGFGNTDIQIHGICNCSCENVQVNNSEACSGNGTLVCGLCDCNEGSSGSTCQCPENPPPCPTINNMECAGNGVCDECNQCICNEGNFGVNCTCGPTTCPQFRGVNCGGRGVCDCPTESCMCDISQPSGFPFFGAREACECDPNDCFNPAFPGELCRVIDGRSDEVSTCNCNMCRCPPEFSNINATCRPGTCRANRPCALCTAGGCTDLEGCNGMIINSTFPVPSEYIMCMFTDGDGCNRTFYVPPNQEETPELPILVELCPTTPSGGSGVQAWIIAVAIVGGILLLGLLILIIIKLILVILARIDYNKFVKMMKEAEWAPHENPLYLSPQQDFKNVAYKKRGGTRT